MCRDAAQYNQEREKALFAPRHQHNYREPTPRGGEDPPEGQISEAAAGGRAQNPISEGPISEAGTGDKPRTKIQSASAE